MQETTYSLLRKKITKSTLLMIMIMQIMIGCDNSSQEKISFFNDVSFSLADTEQLAIIDTTIVNSYENSISTPTFQIPLKNYLEGTGYNIYLGIPYEASFRELFSTSIVKNESLISEDASETSFCRQYDSYTELVYSENNSLIYVLVQYDKSSEAGARLSFNDLLDRFKQD